MEMGRALAVGVPLETTLRTDPRLCRLRVGVGGGLLPGTLVPQLSMRLRQRRLHQLVLGRGISCDRICDQVCLTARQAAGRSRLACSLLLSQAFAGLDPFLRLAVRRAGLASDVV